MFYVGTAGYSFSRAALFATTAIALFAAPFGMGKAVARVGVTSATDGDPLGKPPTEAERVLRIGIDVQANELITTRTNDRAHLVFLDGTSLTVGPDAQLTIDRFVYDPATKKGDLAINATKGVFRLVGGKISKTNAVTITTPQATIGIRGGITIFNILPGKTTSTFIFGNGMTFTAGGKTETVTRPGSQVSATAGTGPGPVTIVGQGGLNSQLSALEGGGGGSSSGTSSSGGQATGGGATGSTNSTSVDQKLQSSGLSSTNSNQSPAAVQPTTNAPAPTSVAQGINNSNAVNNALSNTNTEQQNQQAIREVEQAPPPGTTVIVTQGRLASITDQPYSSFDNVSLAAPRDPANNKALAAKGTVLNGVATIKSADGSTTIEVPWRPGQAFTVGSVTGMVSPNQDFFAYIYTDPVSQKRFGVFGGVPTTTAGIPKSGLATHTLKSVGGVAEKLPFADPTIRGNADLQAAATTSPLYSAYAQTLGIPVPPFALSNERATSLQVTVSIDGQGAAQKSYTGAYIGTYFADYTTAPGSVMNAGGYAGSYRLNSGEQIGRLTSSMTTADTGQGNAIYGPKGEYMVFTPDNARTNGGSTVRTEQAALNQPYTNLTGSGYYPVTVAEKTPSIAVAPDLGEKRTTQTMNGYVGGVIEARQVDGTFSTRVINANEVSPTNVSIATDAATNRAQGAIKLTDFGPTNVIATFEMGSLTGGNLASSAFIDDRRYGMRDRTDDPSRFSKVTTSLGTDVEINARTFLTSYNTAPLKDNLLPGGVTPCECAFMSWGWWSGDVRYDNSGFRQGQRDRLNLATYVVGNLTNVVQLPNTGTATYNGHAVGNVVNGANSYVAAGTYSNAWNFGTQRGQVEIRNFDGATYTGTTALRAGTVNFTGPLAGAGRTGTLSGSFYSGPTSPVAGQGGSFSVSGAGYTAGGTFAAQK